ncbi:MAG: ribbon-helix-helix protein, CopG family [Acidobacteriota bacterium]
MKIQKRRVQFELSQPMVDLIDRLQATTGAESKSEIMRRSLQTYSALVDETRVQAHSTRRPASLPMLLPEAMDWARAEPTETSIPVEVGADAVSHVHASLDPQLQALAAARE